MDKSESISSLAAALAKFGAEVENPKNTSVNPQFRSKYAPLDVVINTVRPIMAKHGLSYLQSTGSEGENIIIKTMILHESGEWIETDPLILPGYQIKGGGAKEWNAQGAGSAITYGRRYSLTAALGISSEDDDDGNAQSVTPQAAQTTSLKDKINAAKPQAPKPVDNGQNGGHIDGIPASLREKFLVYKGSLDGLDAWVTEQMMVKGRSYAQIEATLHAGIEKMLGGKT